MRKRIKIMCLVFALLISLVALTGCSSNISTTSNSDGQKTDVNKIDNVKAGASKKETLTVACAGEPPSLSTCDNDALYAMYLHFLTYNFLYKIDNKTLTPVPDLAESYTIENELDWIFKLKEGVKFHDGTSFTAEDVVATIEYAKTFPASIVYTGHMKSVEAIDDFTVKITTDVPYAGLLYDLGYHYLHILPKEKIESGFDFTKESVGTGPFKFESWDYGNQLTFIKNEEYFNKEEEPTINRVIWKVIPEGTARTIALQAGEVDFIYQVETADLANLKSDPNIIVSEINSVDNQMLAINNDIPPFDNADLRKAIHCAIDRQVIIDGVLNGYAIPSYSMVPVGYWGSNDSYAHRYNLDKAKEYLKAWGGDPSSVRLRILCSTDERTRIATAIQGELSKIGITVEVEKMDYATMSSRTRTGDYVAVINSWQPSNALTYIQRLHSDRKLMFAGVMQNSEIDSLVRKAEGTIDADARLKIMDQIIKEVDDIVPTVSLFQPIITRAYNSNLENVIGGASGYMDLHLVRWK